MAKMALFAKLVVLLALIVASIPAAKAQGEEEVPTLSGKLPPGTPAATVAGAGVSKFQTLLDAALATEPLSNTTSVTILAPTDEAIAAFLKELGLEEADIANNEPLADAIVGYHLILGAGLGPKELFADGNKVAVPTADGVYKVVFTKTPTGVTVTDVQGNVANVVKAGLGTGKHQVHVIDKVLWSGTYWKDLAAVIKALPSQTATFVEAAKKAGLDKTVTAADFSDTLLIPTNAAFKKAGISLSDVKADDLAKVLKYHVIPAVHTLPAGFDSGRPIATLEGTDVTVTFIKESNIAGDKKANYFRAVVRDGQDNHATIIKPNLFYGKNVAHIIDQVLLLPKADDKKGNRRLLQTNKPAAAAVVSTPAAKAETKPGAVTGTAASTTVSTPTKPGAAAATTVTPAATTVTPAAKPAAAAAAAAAVTTPKPAAPAVLPAATSTKTTTAAAAPAGPAAEAQVSGEITVLEVPEADDLGKLDIEVLKAVLSNGAFVETKDSKGKKGNTQAAFHEDTKKYTAVVQADLAKLGGSVAAPPAEKKEEKKP